MAYTLTVRTSIPAVTSVDSAARALPLRSSETLFFWSATRRTSTPRFFACTGAAVIGALVKLYDSTRSFFVAESITLIASSLAALVGTEGNLDAAGGRQLERVVGFIGVDDGLEQAGVLLARHGAADADGTGKRQREANAGVKVVICDGFMRWSSSMS